MIVKNSKIQKYEIFIFSNNFLGKSIRKFIYNNNEKIKYMFDDNSKFRFVKLENYNFNKNVLNIFYVAITDQQIFKKIKKRIYKLNLNKKLIQFIELF